MIKAIKFEAYKLIREQFLWIIGAIILLVAFVMNAGTNVTLDGFIQKSFMTSMIASLYATFYAASDFDNGNIIYLLLSGNTRSKIVLSKFIAVILSSELLILVHPIIQVIIHDEWEKEIRYTIILAYFVLGIFHASLAIFVAWLYRNSGTAVISIIIFHVLSLFLLNSKGVSSDAMNLIPIGIIKLLIEGEARSYADVILFFWIALPLVGALLISKRCDL